VIFISMEPKLHVWKSGDFHQHGVETPCLKITEVIFMGKKTPRKKAMLGKFMKQNRRIPLFVIAKTNRKVVQNRERRSWRSQKLKMRSQKRHRLN